MQWPVLMSFIAVVLLGGCSSQEERFQNIEPVADKSYYDVIKWRLFTDREEWPEWVESTQHKVPTERVEGNSLSYVVINHATVLIQWRGQNILTDPIYSQRASPLSWLGPKRVRAPGVAFEDLPPIDVVLLSHNHYDHFDSDTLMRLEKEHQPLFVAGLKNGALLKELGLSKVREMKWWESFPLGELKVHFVPAQHWSARGVFDRRKTLWGGFSLKDASGKHVYFAGDTGYGKFFKMIEERLGGVDLAFLPIGAYEPRWFMKPQHINPEEAIMAHFDLKSRSSVGIHFETFQLTNEGFGVPRETLNRLWNSKERQSKFVAPEFGKSILIEDF